jgi:endonuclease/exonuclease/phosphatase family metal-dependent hydrolase
VSPTDTVCVISWNTAVGDGNLEALVGDVRRTVGSAPLVILLQEVYREGPEVPRTRMISFAGKLGSESHREIESVAERVGLNLYYVPSMRNGAPWDSDEDRGNAILSTLPLDDFSAIELPFEAQRRVAVAATVSGRSLDGRPWRLRVVSSHLDNLAGVTRGWFIGAQFARLRQTRALLEYLRGEPAIVLAGDFNTWFGFSEPTYTAAERDFPDTHVDDRRATFRGMLRLDHMFFRLPDGWRGSFRRADARYGSDHYPLIGEVTLSATRP